MAEKESKELKEEQLKKEKETTDKAIDEDETQKSNSSDVKKSEKTEIQLKQIELDELNDRYKRVFAEFENYKKRTQKEKENLYNSVLGDIIINILPLIDNLEMAAKAECKDDGYKQGIELIEKQFKEFLNKNKVEEISTIGETFDPNLHEAVSSVQDDTKQSQEIVQEYRKGYKIGSKVLRHAMVVVNQ